MTKGDGLGSFYVWDKCEPAKRQPPQSQVSQADGTRVWSASEISTVSPLWHYVLLLVDEFHNQTAFCNFLNLSFVCILSHFIYREKKSVNHTFTTSVTIFHLHFYFHLFNWLGKSKRGHHLTSECHTNPLF